jgi:hypothetical protein
VTLCPLAAGPDWGTVPDWLAAVGTLAAFAVALRLLAKELAARRQYEEDRRRGQARLVAAWTSTPSMSRRLGDKPSMFDVIVRNGSDEPIYAVVLTMLAPTFYRKPPTGPHVGGGVAFEAAYGVLGPHDEERVTHVVESTSPGPVRVTFTDSQGYRWRRHPMGELELLKGQATRRRPHKDELNAWVAGQVDQLDY